MLGWSVRQLDAHEEGRAAADRGEAFKPEALIVVADNKKGSSE